MTLHLTVDSVVAVAGEDSHTKMEDEVVILAMSRSEYFGLSGVGTRIWELLQKPIRVSRLVDEILLEYDVDRRRCQDDVILFLEELASAKLIMVKESESG